MLILIHVGVAILSIVLSTCLFFFPSRSGLLTSYALVALTLVSGTILAIRTHTHLLQTCLTGLLYVGVVSAGIGFARAKLAQAEHE
jgi:hypothetical protein